MNSSNHNPQRGYAGIPPPPPPPPPPGSVPQAEGVLGSLCPPPPSPSNGNQPHPQFQTVHMMQMQYHQPGATYNYGLPVGNYQIHQYQYPQNFHQQSYQQYTNYNAPPPLPPMPPPQQWNKNPQHKIDNNRLAKNKQSRTNEMHNSHKPEKKINPKMAKKYFGQGLKTITISGPGMPTQKFKICVGNHPDDVRKWIEERRKRFPRSNREEGAGHVNAVVGRKRDREDAGDSNDAKKQCNDGLGEAGGALSSLLSGYDSSSSQEENGIAEISPGDKATKEDTGGTDHSTQNAETTLATSNTPPPTRVCRFYQRGNCRHGESCKFLHSKSNNNTRQPDQDSKRKAQSEQDKERRRYESELQALGLVTSGHSSGNRVVNSTSLLNKLLQRDKERERCLTLQLLRYIVDCDFFQSDRASEDFNAKTTEQSSDDKEGGK